MLTDVEQLIDALRTELQHYGEMLALLDAEANRSPVPASLGAIPAALESICVEGAAVQTARARRIQAQARLTTAPNSAANVVALHRLEVPDDYRPLLAALTTEVEDLAGQVQRLAHLQQSRLTHAAGQLACFIESIASTESTEDRRPINA